MNGFELDQVGTTARVAPAVLDLCEAAALLGVGRTTAYKMVREQKWPTPVLRLGRLIKIPTQPLLDLLCCPSPVGGAASGILAGEGVAVVRGG